MCVSLCDSLLVLSIKHLFTIAFTTAQGKAIQRIKINPFRSYLLLNDTLFVFSKEYVLRQSYQIRGLSKALRSVKPGKRRHNLSLFSAFALLTIVLQLVKMYCTIRVFLNWSSP